jgi:nucleoid-associated protein YgaU
MGITSAAEAKLDARIRPDITVLRSRTSYPRRHRPPLSVVGSGADAGPSAAAGSAATESSEQVASASGTQTFSRTVSTERTTWRVARTERTVMARAAAASRTTVAESAVPRSQPARASSPAPIRSAGGTSGAPPVRLTRRGRIVLGVLITVVVAAMTALIWLAVAGRAEAASHVRPGGSAGHSMLRVVVRPGQTLWSIAAKADPAADPRAVIQEIVDDNALAGTAVQAGQVIWVPRS